MQVLTEEEKSNLLKEWDGTLLGLIDDVETQMLEKLRKQEPTAWILDYQTMGGGIGQKLSWSRSGAEVCRRLQGWNHEYPLYAAPVPSVVPEDVVQDAERYRWLRNNWEDGVNIYSNALGTLLDSDIDYAMQKGTNNGL